MTDTAPTNDGRRSVIIGVDTHKYVPVAVAIDECGARPGELSIDANTPGYRALHEWAKTLGRARTYGMEGTHSYGAGVTRLLRRAGERVVEVNRADRRSRHHNGKSDPLDAESAARSVLNGTATAIPKDAEGLSEMIRQIKVARDSARKARSATMVALKSLVVNAPSELRESLGELSDTILLERCASYRITEMNSVTISAKYSLRSLARRWRDLNNKVKGHDCHLRELTQQLSPTLCASFGVGPDIAAEMLVVFGDNPERVHSEAAFAKICGACPIPASSGITHRHRLFRGGHRHANAALHRAVIVRMRHHEPTKAYVIRRTEEGLTKRDVIRCLKRHLAREIYQCVMGDYRARKSLAEAA